MALGLPSDKNYAIFTRNSIIEHGNLDLAPDLQHLMYLRHFSSGIPIYSTLNSLKKLSIYFHFLISLIF